MMVPALYFTPLKYSPHGYNLMEHRLNSLGSGLKSSNNQAGQMTNAVLMDLAMGLASGSVKVIDLSVTPSPERHLF